MDSNSEVGSEPATAPPGVLEGVCFRAFLARLDIEVGEAMVAARANGSRLDAADAWIAATALSENAPLITHNKSDFEWIRQLTIISHSK